MFIFVLLFLDNCLCVFLTVFFMCACSSFIMMIFFFPVLFVFVFLDDHLFLSFFAFCAYCVREFLSGNWNHRG